MQTLSIVILILKVLRERHRQCWILTLIALSGYWPHHTAGAVGRRGEKRMEMWFRQSWYHREWPAGPPWLGETHWGHGRDGVHKRWHNGWHKVWGHGGHWSWNGSSEWDVMGEGKPAGKSVSADCISYGSWLLLSQYNRKTQRKGSTTEDEMNEPATRDFFPVMMR